MNIDAGHGVVNFSTGNDVVSKTWHVVLAAPQHNLNKPQFHTPHLPVYPRLVMPPEKGYKSDIHVIWHLCNEWRRVNSIQAVSWLSHCNNMILLVRIIIQLPSVSLCDIRRGTLGLKILAILYSTPGRFLNKGTISLPWLLMPFCDFCLPASCCVLCATCCKKSVLCSRFPFSMTHRRLLLQKHDFFFFKYLKKICAVAYAILWYKTAYWSQNNMASEEGYLLKTLL